MPGLLLSTLAMMGLTFVIGFFVAGVIKMIAVAADSLDFYSSHHEELLRLRRLKKLRQKVELLIRQVPPVEEEFIADGREDFSRGINKEFCNRVGYYHGVSHGASKMNLMDYYYPEDTHMVFLEKEDEILNQNKKQNKNSSVKTK